MLHNIGTGPEVLRQLHAVASYLAVLFTIQVFLLLVITIVVVSDYWNAHHRGGYRRRNRLSSPRSHRRFVNRRRQFSS